MRGLARRTLPSASLQLVTSRTEPKKQTRRGRRLRQRREERPAGRARIAGCAAARCARHINFLPRARIAVGDLRFPPIGAGVARLRAAIELASAGRVLVVAKDTLRESSSEYAQGGIAVALSDDDEVELHEQDTLAAGDGLCDPAAVRTLVEEGPAAIQKLVERGAEFDQVGGELAFTRKAPTRAIACCTRTAIDRNLILADTSEARCRGLCARDFADYGRPVNSGVGDMPACVGIQNHCRLQLLNSGDTPHPGVACRSLPHFRKLPCCTTIWSSSELKEAKLRWRTGHRRGAKGEWVSLPGLRSGRFGTARCFGRSL